MNKILLFVNEVKNELRKISWPSRDELVGATIIVCILVLVLSTILGSMDFFFSFVIKKFIM
ncbi:preprotein translocase subunit SecE [Candidatus Babeliales bacterium]|nr:preprotein translocase subunit SecE [Candidatus Babeliales bacterium]